MNVSEALQKRRSVRAYRDKPVEAELLEKIFSLAQQAPSNCNSQPWLVRVLSGASRDLLEAKFMEEIESGKAPYPAFVPGDAALKGVFKARQIDCAVALYGAVGVGRDDREKRRQMALQNWRFFGAPCVAVIAMPLDMKRANALDIGIYLQTLMLLMVENGLACCPQGALSLYPEPVRVLTDIPADYGVICGLSFGYEDTAEAINSCPQERVPLADSVAFFT